MRTVENCCCGRLFRSEPIWHSVHFSQRYVLVRYILCCTLPCSKMSPWPSLYSVRRERSCYINVGSGCDKCSRACIMFSFRLAIYHPCNTRYLLNRTGLRCFIGKTLGFPRGIESWNRFSRPWKLLDLSKMYIKDWNSKFSHLFIQVLFFATDNSYASILHCVPWIKF